ncbi:MAG: hypothetical protein O3C57_03110 [Verrucomicrobia bacterium]|nr:hypothetical protein [Verrucomicrobiota bacterium]
MTTDEKNLYLILYPNPSLVGSQYGPEEFSKHYHIGSTRFYSGKLIFAEIDIAFRNDYFDIEGCLKALVPHADGSPKATRFVCSYRAMEHVDINAIRRLHISTLSSEIISIDPQDMDDTKETREIRVYAEICPISMLLLAHLSPHEFGEYITTPGNAKGAPSIFFTCLELDIDDFLHEFEENPFMSAPFSFIHPSKLRDAIVDMKANPDHKRTKGLALRAPLENISYKSVRHGFWIYSQDAKSKFFPMPSLHDIEVNNFKFWKAM